MAAAGAAIAPLAITEKQRVQEGALNRGLDQLALWNSPIYVRPGRPDLRFSPWTKRTLYLAPGKIIRVD